MRAALFVTIFVISAFAQSSSADDAPRTESRFVVHFNPMPADLDAGDDLGASRVVRVDEALGFAVVLARDLNELRSSLAQDSRVTIIEEDVILRAMFTPNDPYYATYQYGPPAVRANEAWDTTRGSSARTLCITDTGVRSSHEDLGGGRFLGGHDYVNGDTSPADDEGHGTFVTGIAVATINNGRGVAGISQTNFYHVKVLGSSGTGASSDVASGIRWCADRSPIISMSLGGSGSATLKSGIDYAWGKGALLVSATGNSGPCSNCVLYPAAYPEVIAVSATTASNTQWSGSSDGPETELAAPGHEIASTYYSSNSAYAIGSGTSASAPLVAGVAALVWGENPTLTRDQIRTTLQETAKDLGSLGRDNLYGYGLVDAKSALDQVIGANILPIANAGPDMLVGDGNGSGDAVVTLDGRASSDPDGTIVSYEWSEGGVVIATGALTSATFTLGVHTVVLKVVDDRRGEATDSVIIDVRDNLPPIARAGPDMVASDHANVGSRTVRLDGSASTDPDGTVALFAWREGGTLLASTAIADVDLPLGTHTIALEVTDNAGATAMDDIVITIGPNQAPTARAGGDQIKRDADGDGVETAYVSARDSSDPDGTLASFTWFEGASYRGSGEDVVIPLSVGTHTLTLEVTDNGGATSRDDVTITVEPNGAPTAAFAFDCFERTCTFDASGSSDADGSVATYAWQMGDGVIRDGVAFAHDYDTFGTFEVSLVVTDNGGGTDVIVRDVTVVPVAPPTTPPSDPHVIDRVAGDLGGDSGFMPWMDAESAWFEADSRNLYVSMKLADLPSPSDSTSYVTYHVDFAPAYPVADPTWGGRVPSGSTATSLRARATYNPVSVMSVQATGIPAFFLELEIRAASGLRSVTSLGDVEGNLDPATNIIWWNIPRSAIQSPTPGARLVDTRATTAFAVRGLVTFATTIGDDTGYGREFVFPNADAYPVAYRFDGTRDGFVVERDELNSRVVVANDRVEITSDRRDVNDEIFSHALYSARTPETSSFEVTSRWRATTQGNWQRAFPLFLARDGATIVDTDASVAFIHYDSRDSNLRQDPMYRLRYRDANGSNRIDSPWTATADTEYQFGIAYDSLSRSLVLEIKNAAGSVVHAASYTISPGGSDGFTFDKIGVASDGRGMSSEPLTVAWVDDIIIERA